MIKIQEQQARNAIIHFHLCPQTFLVILVITSSRYCHLQTLCVNFQAKWTTLTFSVKICPKMDLSLEIQNTTVGIFRRANFQVKRITLTFSLQICAKMDPGIGISKIKIRIWNQHPKVIMWVNFQSKRTTLNFSA